MNCAVSLHAKLSSKKQEMITFLDRSRLKRSSKIAEERTDLPVPATP